MKEVLAVVGVAVAMLLSWVTPVAAQEVTSPQDFVVTGEVNGQVILTLTEAESGEVVWEVCE